MIDSVPGALPDVTHPPAAPNTGKPKGPEDEERFAHQVKQLVAKEQQELADSRKVKEEEKRENKRKREKRKKKEKLEQDVSTDKDNLPTKKGGSNGVQKGTHIDVEA